MADSDLDPQAFLKTVRDLSDKRQKEDNERFQQLEAQIIQDRNTRLERRMERERSLSPEKTSQSPRSIGTRTPVNGTPPRSESISSSPRREPAREDARSRAMSPLGQEATTPIERPSSPSKASPSAAMPSRANTMSWQRRPQSGMRNRPLSLLAHENNSIRTSPVASPSERPNSRDDPSRQDIAQALGSKDPAFFRQTADRGIGSAAYRRNRDEDSALDDTEQKRQLPGLNRNSSIGSEGPTSPPANNPTASPPARFGSVRDSAILNTSIPEDSLPATGDSGIERTSTPEAEKVAFGRSMPSLHGRMASDRPPSPTKGMGGFVQSAMLKRNDSVNKRWSAQSGGGGLSRENSTASLRSGFGSLRNVLAGSSSMTKLDQARERAESDASTVSAMSSLNLQESESRGPLNRQGSLHSRSKSIATLRDPPAPPADIRTPFSPPLSPSKRFSPTKSSWLESALARPESPKPSSTQSTQPSWMAELNKVKQQRNSAESTLSHEDSQVFQANPVSLQRSSTRDLGISGLSHRVISPPTKAKPPTLAAKPISEPKLEEIEKAKEPLKHEGIHKSEEPEKPVALNGGSSKEKEVVTGAARSSPYNDASASAPKPATTPTGVTPKPKPETPPKKEFRSTLKSRELPTNNGSKSDLEFRNALGKLKKTETEKYVAPDILKQNILHGKAGLSVTDGPQKTQRRDEFRESLLKQKEEMKSKAGESPVEDAKKISPAPTQSIPEALLIKKQLGRSDSNHSFGAANPRRDITPEALARHKTVRGKAAVVIPGKPSNLSDRPTSSLLSSSQDKSQGRNEPLLKPSEKSAAISEQPKSTEKLFEKQVEKPMDKPVEERSEVTKPTESPVEKPLEKALDKSVLKPVEKRLEEVNMSPAIANSRNTEPAKTTDPPKSSKFADRFNPALANILARGPPGLSNGSSTPSRSSSPAHPASQSQHQDDTSSGQQLTHMTKSRAKGPKRRKPNAAAVATSASAEDVPAKEPVIEPLVKKTRPASIQISQTAVAPSAGSPLQPPPKSAAIRAVSSSLSAKPAEQDKPTTPKKSASMSLKSTPTPEIKVGSHTAQRSSISATPAAARLSRQLASSTEDTRVTASPVRQEPSTEDDKENQDGLPSVKNAAATWGKRTTSSAPSSKSMPIKLPSREDEEAAMKSVGLLSSSPMRYNASGTGLGITERDESPKTSRQVSLERGPPKPAKSSRVVSSSLKGIPAANDSFNGTVSTSHASKLIHDYLGSIPSSEPKLEVDTQAMLSNKPGLTVSKTLRKSIQEISGDGKLMSLPAQEEHVLYESSIYVVTHVFGSQNGSRLTEVYLWAGATVPEAAVADAQIFAKRVAREAASGPRSTPAVILVHQGREPAEFFQALGGIVITRRGARANAATKAYMLCGRPHIGHVAFDEVDLSTRSFCSAFPYVVVHPLTIQESKVYLWRGSHCGPEAVGSARLISMDLNSSSADVVEVAEGRETEDFWTVFAHEARRHPAAKAESLQGVGDRLSPRLFRIEALAPRKSSSAFLSLFTSGRGSISRPSSAHRPNSSASGKSITLTSPSLDGVKPQIAATELSPPSQMELEPEHVYILDCIGKVYVLAGPLLTSNQYWEDAFTQALLFANEYAILAASVEDRMRMPQAEVIFGALPLDAKHVFRSWDESRGLWGSGGLMAGRAQNTHGEDVLSLREALDVCCFAR